MTRGETYVAPRAAASSGPVAVPGPGERANAGVTFVGGAGHSGSTLLGLVLGAHPQVFYAGEARKSLLFDDARKPMRKRMCKVCGPGCAVWSGLERRTGEDLYEALSRRTARPLVVDSTKKVSWIEEQSRAVRAAGAEVRLLVLVRDGRAVVNSGLRKYPEISPEAHARRWVEQLAATDALAARFEGPVLRLRYEDMVQRPRETFESLTTTLGIEFVPTMLEPWGAEQHPLGGNAGTQSLLDHAQTRADGPLALSGEKRAYYAAHPRSFVLDLRWRRELSSAARAASEAVAGEANAPYAWDDEGGP